MTQLGIVLASASPRRQQMVGWLGYPVRVHPTHVDETPYPGEAPEDLVVRLAVAKARAAADIAPPGWVTVGGDTAVVHQGRILGKPADAAEARAMLEALRGNQHIVCSGVAVFRPQDGALWTAVVRSTVFMRHYTDEELAAYIASGDPLDKAGGYAIQHDGFRPVARIEGCFANVVGLPMCHLAQGVAALLGPPSVALPARCMESFGYNCPIHESIFPYAEAVDTP